MGIRAIFIALRLALSLLELTLLVRLPGRVNGLKQQFPSEQTSNTSGVTAEASSVKCSLQGKSRLPAFSRDGDFVIGGVATIHSQDYAMVYNYTTQPESPRCTKRSVRKRSGKTILYVFAAKSALMLESKNRVFLLLH